MLIFKKYWVGFVFFLFFFSFGVREMGICLVTGACPPSAESRASRDIATTLGARPHDTDHSETDHATASIWEGLWPELPSSF